MKSLIAKKLGLVVAVSSFIIFGYQNCSKNRFDSPKILEKSPGNGDNYDGKPYNYSLPGQVCPDGSAIISQITYEKLNYSLTRDNCAQVLPPKQIPESEIIVAPDGHSLAYSGRVYVDSEGDPRFSMGCQDLMNELSALDANQFPVGSQPGLTVTLHMACVTSQVVTTTPYGYLLSGIGSRVASAGGTATINDLFRFENVFVQFDYSQSLTFNMTVGINIGKSPWTTTPGIAGIYGSAEFRLDNSQVIKIMSPGSAGP